MAARLHLYVAAEKGELQLVTELIAAGHDVNTHVDQFEDAHPLHGAAWSGNREVVVALLTAGAKVDALDDHGCTPLHHVRSGAAAAALLAAGASVSAADSEGNTPLHIARNADVAAALLAAGASVSATNHRGQAPLHTAQSAEVVSALLAAGASVQARDQDGCTPLLAMFCPNERYVLGSEVTDKASQLIAGGSDLQATNSRGRNALHLASGLYLPDLVQELLARGLSAHARDADGRTALHLSADATSSDALESSDEAVAKLLVAAGADINAPDALGATPLHCLAHRAAEPAFDVQEELEYLLTAGADAMALDHSGKSVLQWLCEAAVKQMAVAHDEVAVAWVQDRVVRSAQLLLQAGATAEGLPPEALEMLAPVLDSQARQLQQQCRELAELWRQVAELSTVTPALQELVVDAAGSLAALRRLRRGSGERP